MESFVTQLVCIYCRRRFEPGCREGQWLTCDVCGAENGILDVQYDLDAVREAWRRSPLSARPPNQWRYRELLPIDPSCIPPGWEVGWTPLVVTERLADELGLACLMLKDDGRNPTASFKDRASAVGVVDALSRDATTVACASTGNAATSLAGHAALAGVAAVIFVPESAPEPKLAQLLIYGATVVSVEGTYDEAYRLCMAACERWGWYNRNCAINPVLVEGKKTAGLEIAEQCQSRRLWPDWVAVSVGDGCTVAGIAKGLAEMEALGVCDRRPRLLGVQAEGAAPICDALLHGTLPDVPGAGTLADSINVPVPRNWRKAVRAIQESDGRMVRVTDDAILDAMRLAGRHGVFAEPAAAAALAGVVSAVSVGTIRPGQTVLVMITGSGLKDTRAAIRAGGAPLRIPPDLEQLAALLHCTAPGTM